MLWGGAWVFTVFVSAGQFRGPLLWEAVPENSQWVFRIILGILLLWELGLPHETVPCPGGPEPQTNLSMTGRWGACREAVGPSFVIQLLEFC